ncbi:LysR substrate-binding domain-containing protein [Sphingosinicella rhizophila]|uniref:LysR substrate-binding domain-containing protein n=1 Tax=Sphingosinicella rhizophila TaxID=3050082 RepID=A0ABU3Q621_9SPHN|nr:LysR substrate-binding domain-containing protein [Sphingosinicella sp. GR2756]MDT9598845.1 LysR substrate-binding domain-containing protein [Sphingosinicella sp. GR2756]
MPRELPNLDWLRVFSATAATESFALAAAELGVTPGAISQRIKALESFLDISLFQRYPQGVKLTEAGKRYAQRVLPSLEQLAMATREMTSNQNTRAVRLTILPALAQLWLGSRMDHFHKLHTNATIEIWADAAVVDLRTSNFDVAIRYGRPPFPGCDYRELFFDQLVPVASPELIATSELDDQGLPIGAPLMMDTYWQSDFDDWLASSGQRRPANLMTQTFSLYSMTVEATVHGRGFMIGHTALIGSLLDEGKLQILSDNKVTAQNQFYLLTKTAVPLSDGAETFVNWILEQAAPSETQIVQRHLYNKRLSMQSRSQARKSLRADLDETDDMDDTDET